MAIDIGDAILTLSAPTTQLEQDLNKVPGIVQGKLAPAGAQVDSLGKKFGDVGTAATGSANSIAAAGDKASASMRSTTEATRTVEEAIGVRLPRGVNNFLSSVIQLPELMEAAFSVTAVGFLIVAVAEATQKIAELATSTYLYSEAAKKSDEETAQLNASLITLNKELALSVLAFEEVGASAQQKAALAIGYLNDTIKESNNTLAGLRKEAEDAQKALNQATDLEGNAGAISGFFLGIGRSVANYKNELLGLPPAYKSVAEATADVAKTQTAYQAALVKSQTEIDNAAAKAKQAGIDALNADIATQNTRIAAAKTSNTALLELQYQLDRQRVLSTADSSAQLTVLEKQYQQQLYQIELTADQQRLSQLKRNSTENKDEIIALYADIKKLTADFKATQLKDFNDLYQGISNLAAVGADRVKEFALGIQGFGKATDTLEGLKNSLYQVGDAEKALGIQEQNGRKNLVASTEAFHILSTQYNAGKISIEEYREALERLYEQQEKEGKLLPALNNLTKLYQQDVQSAGKQTMFFGDVGKEAFTQFADAAGEAFDSFLQGQQAFGTALKEATAQTLDSIAAQAFANALYFTGWGIADTFWNPARAGADFASAAQFAAIAAISGAAGYGIGAAGGSSTSASAGGTADTSSAAATPPAATQAQPNPVLRSNAQSAVTGPAQNAGTVINLHVNGLVSPDNLKKVVKQISAAVNKRQVRLTSSDITSRLKGAGGKL